ncbi:NUDIX domain-containing protein [Pseudodonghicola flavimaris]|uniref:ADP-ribose pyrophosphatase n=1 Tax=Pseudodonghicola flavimaris TaxID=3050036 RepID=A0ABT7F1Q0_9RHOB|nr:NUDIX domain-containing protein [Pseudodonghicola flavimaris]MDK3018531.1 NUDIX domain-containing protein [Pseudodonghicola flavimaris]
MTKVLLHACLRHLPLLETVLGHSLDVAALSPATLPGYRLAEAAGGGGWDAVLIAAVGETVPGLILSAGAEDVARLDYYQTALGQRAAEVVIDAVGAVRIYLPESEGRLEGIWNSSDWEAKWSVSVTRAATEMMAWYGRLDAKELGRRLHGLRLRAAARTAIAEYPAQGGHDINQDVKMIEHRFAYMDYFGMEEAWLQFRRHDGSFSEPLPRSTLATGRASVVLPYDPRRDCVLLVEQFRAPLYLAGDPAPWLWEPVAGMIDPGETPEQAARREAEEEAGLRLTALEKAGEAYSSSGSSMEYCHLFVGLADLGDAEGIGGLATEGEDIRSQVVPYADLMAGIDAQRYRDMPLMILALWLARHRDRLRAQM